MAIFLQMHYAVVQLLTYAVIEVNEQKNRNWGDECKHVVLFTSLVSQSLTFKLKKKIISLWIVSQRFLVVQKITVAPFMYLVTNYSC